MFPLLPPCLSLLRSKSLACGWLDQIEPVSRKQPYSLLFRLDVWTVCQLAGYRVDCSHGSMSWTLTQQLLYIDHKVAKFWYFCI
ncbi:hypothetical protein ACFX1Z_006409 [Malus domestica]